jgi:hypothetical protein
MRSGQPPRVAAWLLDRLASGPKRESLIGDLAEQYHRGRSSAWYWRQTVREVLLSAARDIQSHQLIAIRAVVVSWMFLIPWVFFTGWAFGSTRFWVQTTILKGSATLQDLWAIYQAPLLIMWCLGSATIGWIIARLDANCRTGMLAICAASQLPFSLQWGWPMWRLANAGLPFFATFPVVVGAACVIVVMPLSLVLGGLTAMAPHHHAADYGTRTTGARQNATF